MRRAREEVSGAVVSIAGALLREREPSGFLEQQGKNRHSV